MAIPDHLQPLTAAAGYLPSTMERTLRVLRPAKLVPQGSRGLGDGTDWSPRHLSNLLFSLASIEPIHAAETVSAFAACTYWVSTPLTVDQFPQCGPGTLGEILIAMIEGVARWLEQKKSGIVLSSSARALPYHISFRHNPLRADLVWIDPAGRRQEDSYTEKDQQVALGLGPWRSSAVYRTITVPSALIGMAGEMWFATCQRRNATRETNNAEALPGAPAPCRDQPTGLEGRTPTVQSTQAEPMAHAYFEQPAVPAM